MDEKLIEELKRLNNISADVSTCEHSEQDKRVSFFERVEGRKNAFKEAANKVNISIESNAQSNSMYVRQPEHPFKAEERNILQIMANQQTSISIEEYFAHYY